MPFRVFDPFHHQRSITDERIPLTVRAAIAQVWLALRETPTSGGESYTVTRLRRAGEDVYEAFHVESDVMVTYVVDIERGIVVVEEVVVFY